MHSKPVISTGTYTHSNLLISLIYRTVLKISVTVNNLSIKSYLSISIDIGTLSPIFTTTTAGYYSCSTSTST